MKNNAYIIAAKRTAVIPKGGAFRKTRIHELAAPVIGDLYNERHDVDMGNVSVPHFGVHLSRKDFDTLKQRLKDNGTKYYDEPYLRFKGTKYEQETFFVKDPNENVLEIKTLTANPE